jgi:hypothetical protein
VIRTVESWSARGGSVRGNGSARPEVLVPVPIGAAVAVTVAVLYICWLAFVLLGGTPNRPPVGRPPPMRTW